MNYSVLSGDIHQSDLPLIMYFFRNIYWLPLWHQFLVKSLSSEGTLWPLNSGVIGTGRKSASRQRSASAAKLTPFLAASHSPCSGVQRLKRAEQQYSSIILQLSPCFWNFYHHHPPPPHPPCQFYLLFSNALSLPLSCGIDFLLFSSSWPWEASGPD